jgi:hypothetical protein
VVSLARRDRESPVQAVESARVDAGQVGAEHAEVDGAKVFPYGTVYFVRDDEVIVVAYAHERRRRGYWRDRLNDP